MALPRCRPGAVATPRRDQKRPQQSTERTNKSIVASSTCWWITLTRVTPTLQAKKPHLHQQRVLAQENPKRTPQTSSNPVLLLNSRESTSGCRAPRLLRPTRPPHPPDHPLLALRGVLAPRADGKGWRTEGCGAQRGSFRSGAGRMWHQTWWKMNEKDMEGLPLPLLEGGLYPTILLMEVG